MTTAGSGAGSYVLNRLSYFHFTDGPLHEPQAPAAMNRDRASIRERGPMMPSVTAAHIRQMTYLRLKGGIRLAASTSG